jgi:hypothetical protein
VEHPQKEIQMPTTIDRRVAQAEAYVQSRFYPPLPSEYGALAVQAVDACNEGDLYREFAVGHLNPTPRYTDEDGNVTAAALVEVLRLGHMIEEDFDDDAE